MAKYNGYADEADWTEKHYENFKDKVFLEEYHKRNPQAVKDNRIKIRRLN
jgi:hypothetical protein